MLDVFNIERMGSGELTVLKEALLAYTERSKKNRDYALEHDLDDLAGMWDVRFEIAGILRGQLHRN